MLLLIDASVFTLRLRDENDSSDFVAYRSLPLVGEPKLQPSNWCPSPDAARFVDIPTLEALRPVKCAEAVQCLHTSTGFSLHD